MPEFQTRAGREAFVSNHELTGYDKKAWKAGEGGLTLAKKLRLYAELGAEDPAQRVEELSAKLVELDALIHCVDCCSGGGLSLDDIDLWSRLRSITIVKGVVWPEKTRAYVRARERAKGRSGASARRRESDVIYSVRRVIMAENGPSRDR
jgi:hypothetical protein